MNLARISLLVTLVLYFFFSWTYVGGTPKQEFFLPDSVPRAQRDTPVLAGLGPDEKEYLLYVRALAETGRPPRITPEFRKSDNEFVCYQAQHPPLFFLLSVPLWKLTSGGAFWTLWRSVCVLMGALVILLSTKAALLAFPQNRLVEVLAAPSVGLVPIFGHLMGHVSNEPLAMVFGSWAWLQVVQRARCGSVPTTKEALLLGLALGLSLLSRLTGAVWCLMSAVVLVLVFRKAALKPLVLAFGLAFLCLAPWLLDNFLSYGKPLMRPFNNPLLANGATLVDYFSLSGIRPTDSPTTFTPVITLLFWSATGWTPFWLIGRYLPGGMRGMEQNATYILVLDLVLGLALFENASQGRRGLVPRDPAARALLWGAGVGLGFMILVLFQQMFFVDWNVLQSSGRYTCAILPLTAVLFLAALTTLARRLPERGQLALAGVVGLGLLAASWHTTHLVAQFYTEFPHQPAYQRIAPPETGKVYFLSNTPFEN